MQENNRKNRLLRGAAMLRITIEFDHYVKLYDGTVLSTIARLPTFGGVNGMLIFAKYAEVKPYWRHLSEMGYGFSVLDEVQDDSGFDIDSFRAMLIDWGWSGEPENKPNWIV